MISKREVEQLIARSEQITDKNTTAKIRNELAYFYMYQRAATKLLLAVAHRYPEMLQIPEVVEFCDKTVLILKNSPDFEGRDDIVAEAVKCWKPKG